MSLDPLAEDYVRLALAIDQHRPGYIDAYYGPADWKHQVEREGKRPLDELSQRAADLAAGVSADRSTDGQRRDFLSRHVRAMQTSLRLLSGEKMSLAAEAEGIYDIRPAWTDEVVFEEQLGQLDELLPAGGTLHERLTRRKRALEISKEKTKDLLPFIQARLRELARERFPLPVTESLEFTFVRGHAWSAYNWYLGAGRSRIEINTDLPMQATRLVEIVAHEAYPGHHTELSIKDTRLHQEQRRLEHSLALINSPSAVVAEGIATTALWAILPDEELATFYAKEILRRAGLDVGFAAVEPKIRVILDKLGNASDNAAFMLHERGYGEDEVATYLKMYELLTEDEARKRIDFIRDPLDRAYIFTYGAGQQLLQSLFAVKKDVTRWFTRVLSEPVTPSQIRGWIGRS